MQDLESGNTHHGEALHERCVEVDERVRDAVGKQQIQADALLDDVQKCVGRLQVEKVGNTTPGQGARPSP